MDGRRSVFLQYIRVGRIGLVRIQNALAIVAWFCIGGLPVEGVGRKAGAVSSSHRGMLQVAVGERKEQLAEPFSGGPLGLVFFKPTFCRIQFH
jgi:hypothetical protein